MELLVILAFVLTGYFLYRKWKTLRAYNRRLQPRIPAGMEGVSPFFEKKKRSMFKEDDDRADWEWLYLNDNF